MLIRCRHCYTPFTLTPETMHTALDQLEERGWKHYNAYCPRCGKPNVVPRDQLMRAAPEWSPDGIQPAPRPAVVTTPVAEPAKPAAAKPAPKPAKAAAKKPAVKKAPAKKAAAKPAAKKVAAKKPPAKKAAKAKKPAKKAAAKKKKK
jgi:hypothetical protein